MNVLIIGGGQVGTYIAKALLESNNSVTVVEKRLKSLALLEQTIPSEHIIEGDGADPKTLEAAGITDADVVALVTGADEINLVASTIAKFEYGTPRVIGRVNNPKNEWLFTEDMGVDIKVSQANLLANIIIDQIDLDNMVTLMRLNKGDNSIVQATVCSGSKIAGAYIKDIAIPEDTILIAVKRGDQTIVPKGDTQLKEKDHLLAYTGLKGQKEFMNLMK